MAPRPVRSKTCTMRGVCSSFCSEWPSLPYPPKPHVNTRFFASIATWNNTTSSRTHVSKTQLRPPTSYIALPPSFPGWRDLLHELSHFLLAHCSCGYQRSNGLQDEYSRTLTANLAASTDREPAMKTR